jgi:hypothetical protein
MNIDNSDTFVIFLDIDGVLCSYKHNIYNKDKGDIYNPIDDEHYFLQSAIDALNILINNYNAHLCMITSWNSKFKDENQYKEFLINRGIVVNNGLSIGKHYDRYNYVSKTIQEYNLKNYLIIDDESHGFYKECFICKTIEYKRIIKTNSDRCLDSYDAASCIKWVNII